MNFIRSILAIIASVALALSIIGAGFLVCTLPATTNTLANFYSDDATSPFSRSQLVQVADATRDYAFGDHNLTSLYGAVFKVDLDFRQDILMNNGVVPYGFPDLDSVKDPGDIQQIEAAFAGASEMYCYSAQTISHLDDCFKLAQNARVILAIGAIIALACLIACGAMGGTRTVGKAMFAAGGIVIVLLVAGGIFAAVDFTDFFAVFHNFFFSQGNWQFSYDSLLICTLPTAFWVGMVVVWLVVSLVVSILSIIIGKSIQK